MNEFFKDVQRIIVASNRAHVPLRLEVLGLINFIGSGGLRGLKIDINNFGGNIDITKQALAVLDKLESVLVESLARRIHSLGKIDDPNLFLEVIKMEFGYQRDNGIFPEFTYRKDQKRFNKDIALTKNNEGELNEFGILRRVIRNVEKKGYAGMIVTEYHNFLKNINGAIGKMLKAEQRGID